MLDRRSTRQTSPHFLPRSPGSWAQLIAVAHAGVAALLYRDVFADVARHGAFDSVLDRGDRATALWFSAAAPALWTCGTLLRSAESSGDQRAQGQAGAALAVTGLAGAVAQPRSGFWAVAATGLVALRRSRATP